MLRPAQGILLVDDNSSLTRMLSECFRLHGMPTWQARTGADGLAVLEERRTEIGLVMLDLGMPKMNGIEMLRKMKERAPTTRCCVLTGGLPEGVSESDLYDSGAERILYKPFSSIVRLVDEVRALMNQIPSGRSSRSA